jgi:hypothetical protein
MILSIRWSQAVIPVDVVSPQDFPKLELPEFAHVGRVARMLL